MGARTPAIQAGDALQTSPCLLLLTFMLLGEKNFMNVTVKVTFWQGAGKCFSGRRESFLALLSYNARKPCPGILVHALA